MAKKKREFDAGAHKHHQHFFPAGRLQAVGCHVAFLSPSLVRSGNRGHSSSIHGWRGSAGLPEWSSINHVDQRPAVATPIFVTA